MKLNFNKKFKGLMYMKNKTLTLIIISVFLLVCGCGKTEYIDKIDTCNNDNIQVTKTLDNTKKITWILDKLETTEENVNIDTYRVDNILYTICDETHVIPFSGAVLTECGFLDSNTGQILNRSVSYGDIRVRHLGDKGDTLRVEYMNNGDSNLSREDCLVSHIESTSELVGLTFESSLNNEETDIITIGTSLDNIINLLIEHKYEIVYDEVKNLSNNTEVENQYNKIKLTIDVEDDSWEIIVDNVKITEETIENNKYIPSELNGEKLKNIDNIQYKMIGNNSEGLQKIIFEYTVTNCNELSYRYDMLNK